MIATSQSILQVPVRYKDYQVLMMALEEGRTDIALYLIEQGVLLIYTKVCIHRTFMNDYTS